MIISDFPVLASGLPTGFPEFTYSGEYSVLDDGSTSGVKQVAFLTSGTLTLVDDAVDITIQGQGGGGGGGAGSESTSGGDGADGFIQTYAGNLSSGEYSISIGAAGTAGSQGAGGTGGETSMGDILVAAGGGGGAYKGNASRNHSGLYGTYGHGGSRGTSSDYSESSVITYYVSGAGATLYTSASTSSATSETLTSGKHKTYSSQNSSFYQISGGTHSGKYVKASDVTWTKETTSVTKRYYGFAGNPGIVILSGKA